MTIDTLQLNNTNKIKCNKKKIISITVRVQHSKNKIAINEATDGLEAASYMDGFFYQHLLHRITVSEA